MTPIRSQSSTFLVAVGIGNSTIQFAASEIPRPASAWRSRIDVATQGFDPEQLVTRLPTESCSWRIASVHRASEERLANWVRQVRRRDDYQNLHFYDLPLQIDLREPEKIGMDRLVAAVGANRLRQRNQPAVVVDAGTAITVDLIGDNGAFRGGAILPGLRMAARALSADTDALPEIETTFSDDPPVVGTSTVSALRSGLLWGSVGAIREIVQRISLELGQEPQLFVTGGNAEQLASRLDLDARCIPDLLLDGIAAAVEGPASGC